MKISTSFTLFVALAFISILVLAIPGSAQCEAAIPLELAYTDDMETRASIKFVPGTRFGGTHGPQAIYLARPSSWTIINATILQKARAEADPVRKAQLYAQATPDVVKSEIDGDRGVVLTIPGAFTKNETYLVNVAPGNGAIPDECLGPPLPIAVRKVPAGGPGNTGSTAIKKKVEFDDAESREKAEIYVEGMMEGARREKAAFTIDASVGKRFYYKSDPADADSKLPEYFFEPFFNIKASTSDGADPNSLNFGVKFENPKRLKDEPAGLRRIYFTEAAKFEADRDFKNVNFVGDFRARFRFKWLTTRWANFTPFVGLEIGKNLRSPVLLAKGKLIARPLFGASLFSTWYRQNEGTYIRSLTFESLYERRFPLKAEIALDDNEDGSFIGVPISKAPRDYLKNSLTYNFAKHFGFTLNYEYGSLPPLFKLVDHKFGVGIVFKGKFTEKKLP